MLHFSEELRWVSVFTDWKTKLVQKVPVITLLLADVTGPIALELWRLSAEKVFKDLTAWSASDSTVWVEIRYMSVRTEKGKSFPTARKIIGTERTTVTQCSPLPMHGGELPAECLHSRDFSVLSASPPFMVSLTGVITSVLEETSSQAGTPMRSFRLQDQSGRYVRCTACGRHVDNELLLAQNEVTLFFTKALVGLHGDAGSLWLYDTSHVTLHRQQCITPSAQVCMELR